ncbi:MAG TPA: cation-translocating P-type ATPase, partial [Deltaproteobacteria bacterium]|nr:cation-translocating P-type ATPase [Deltaproteobacteria bacterium]
MHDEDRNPLQGRPGGRTARTRRAAARTGLRGDGRIATVESGEVVDEQIMTARREAIMQDEATGTDEKKREFLIRGMDCADEIESLRQALLPIVGTEDRLMFDLIHSKLIVDLPEECSEEKIISAVSETGMSATLFDPSSAEESEARTGSLRTMLTITSGAALVAGFLTHSWIAGSFLIAFSGDGSELRHAVPWAARALYLVAIASGLALVIPKAWAAARRLRPDMNFLMTIAVSGALGIDEWFEAAAVSFLFAVSLELESWSLDRARRAISALMDLSPPTVLLERDDGSHVEVDPAEVEPGSRFLVRPGDRIALDGEIVEGESEVDQSPITGESIPAPKAPGDEVFAGTVNGGGALVVVSTRPATETALAHIVRLVAEAHSRRAPSEQWVQRFSRGYTPAVMVLAASVFIFPTLFGEDPETWFYRALVLLVIACPCALVISTPVSIVAGLAGAARNGILIKGGVFLEAPARIRSIAFDKTGTLTEGRPRVQAVVGWNGHDADEVLERAAAMEMRSAHPLARAIVEHALARGLHPAPANDFQAVHGKGGTARIGG